MDLIILLLGIGMTVYGLFILLAPNKYFDWLKQQSKLTKAEVQMRYLWQVRVRGIIYLVIGIVFLVWGIVRM